MVATDLSYPFPAEHEAFFAEFQALMKKHPDAAARFALADVGVAGKSSTQDHRPPELHCFQTEWGLICPPSEPIL